MSGWNYRIVEAGGVYRVHEAYYNDKGEVDAISERPVCPQGESINEFLGDYELWKEALNRPVLHEDDLPSGKEANE